MLQSDESNTRHLLGVMTIRRCEHRSQIWWLHPPLLRRSASSLENMTQRDFGVVARPSAQLHLQGHSMFQGSPEGQMLAPPMKDALEQHIRDHVAATIRKQMGGQNGQQQQGPGGSRYEL